LSRAAEVEKPSQTWKWHIFGFVPQATKSRFVFCFWLSLSFWLVHLPICGTKNPQFGIVASPCSMIQPWFFDGPITTVASQVPPLMYCVRINRHVWSWNHVKLTWWSGSIAISDG
jgi:hypothetical protein